MIGQIKIDPTFFRKYITIVGHPSNSNKAKRRTDKLVLSLNNQQQIKTTACISSKNMLGYRSLDIIFSVKQTVFRAAMVEGNCKLRFQKTVRFSEQIMSEERFWSIFLKPNGDYCVYYPSNIFRNTRALKTGEYHLDIVQF